MHKIMNLSQELIFRLINFKLSRWNYVFFFPEPTKVKSVSLGNSLQYNKCTTYGWFINSTQLFYKDYWWDKRVPLWMKKALITKMNTNNDNCESRAISVTGERK